MKLRKIAHIGSAFMLSLSSLLTITVATAGATGQSCVWTGNGGDNELASPSNWTSCGSGAPTAGDVIIFPQLGSGTSTKTLTNHLGVALLGVSLGTTSDTGQNYTNYSIDTLHIAGTSATLLGVKGSDQVRHVNLAVGSLTVDNNLTLDGTSPRPADSSNNLTVPVGGNLTVIGTNASVGGSMASYIVYQPTGTVTISDGADVGYMDSATSTTVEKGGTLQLFDGVDATKPITLGGGAGTDTPLIFGANTHITGALTLLDNAQVGVYGGATTTVSGSLSGAFTLTKTADSTGTLEINASPNTSNTPNGSQVSQRTETTLSDDQASAPLYINAIQTVILDGVRGDTVVDQGGVLKGTGKVSGLLNMGGTLAPGHSPGCMQVGNGLSFTSTGILDEEVGGSTACSGYDQMQVTGTVTLGDATLRVTRYNEFKPVVGQSYTIIDNDGSDPVSGTFVGLAEGAQFSADGVDYTITYVGGDGNDVVITVKSGANTKTPNTGFSLVSANPVVSLLTTTMAAGALIVLARRFSAAK